MGTLSLAVATGVGRVCCPFASIWIEDAVEMLGEEIGVQQTLNSNTEKVVAHLVMSEATLNSTKSFTAMAKATGIPNAELLTV